MPLKTDAPVVLQESSVTVDTVAVETLIFDNLYTRLPEELPTVMIKRAWVLAGREVNYKRVSISPVLVAEELARPDVQAAYATLRAAAYRMLKAAGQAPADAQLVD
jgi:hypothetical protein